MKLAEWRDGFGYSVEYIAERLGCTRQSVYRYERPLFQGGRLPDAATLREIVRMTSGDVTPNDWFELHEYAPFKFAAPSNGFVHPARELVI